MSAWLVVVSTNADGIASVARAESREEAELALTVLAERFRLRPAKTWPSVKTGRMFAFICPESPALEGRLAGPIEREARRVVSRSPWPPEKLKPCGTVAAYNRHVKYGEPIDEACQLANRVAKREQWRQSKRRRPMWCGTWQGYKIHARRGEPACGPCIEAYLEQQGGVSV